MTQIKSDLRRLEAAEIPPDVANFMTGGGISRFVLETPQTVEGISSFFSVEHELGTSYVGFVEGQESPEDSLLLVDKANDERLINGVASVINRRAIEDDEFFRDKPFVVWTETFEGRTRRGLAVCRLMVLNSVCIELFGTVLNSGGTFQHSSARTAWERLERAGQVERYQQKRPISKELFTRFRFK